MREVSVIQAGEQAIFQVIGGVRVVSGVWSTSAISVSLIGLMFC